MTGLSIGEIVKVAGPVGAALTDAWQGLIGDRIAAWRLRNAADTQTQILKELREKGLSLNHSRIPERYAFAWFEEASKQDEPELQALFARLLAKASQGDEDALDRRLIALLGQFTPMEAKVLDAFYKPPLTNQGRPDGFVQVGWSWPEDHVRHRLEQDLGSRALLAVDQLVTIGVFKRDYVGKAKDRLGRFGALGVVTARGSTIPLPDIDVQSNICETDLGMALHRALFGP